MKKVVLETDSNPKIIKSSDPDVQDIRNTGDWIEVIKTDKTRQYPRDRVRYFEKDR